MNPLSGLLSIAVVLWRLLADCAIFRWPPTREVRREAGRLTSPYYGFGVGERGFYGRGLEKILCTQVLFCLSLLSPPPLSLSLSPFSLFLPSQPSFASYPLPPHLHRVFHSSYLLLPMYLSHTIFPSTCFLLPLIHLHLTHLSLPFKSDR